MDNPYHHGQQPPTIDMLAVYGGAKEFTGDSFSFDLSQAPPLGQPLLSGTEQNLMADFFTHPDDFSSGKHVAFGYYEETSSSTTGGNTVDPAPQARSLSHVRPSHASSLNFNGAFNINGDRNTNTFSAGDINGMATYTREAMSLNDVAAANTLSGFRNNTSNDSSTPFELDGASWGAMSMSGLIAPGPSGYGSDRQWLHSSTPRPSNGVMQSRDGNGNLVEMVMGDMQRGTYVPTAAQNNQGSRPFGTFGSDTSFANGTFIGNSVDHSQKGGNLLGLPLAAQAAGTSSHGDNAAVRTSHSATQLSGGNANYGQITPQYSAAWNSTAMNSHLGQNKRRKSNSNNGVKQEPGSDDDEADNDKKRRKPMATTFQATHTPSYAPSYPAMLPAPQMQYAHHGPMMLPPQDMRRTPARKKENLTDDQKRANHIISEKKRREIINQGYRDLNDLTPALAMGKSGLSRSECLTEINNYLYSLQLANARLIKDLQLDPAAFAIPPPVSHNNGY